MKDVSILNHVILIAILLVTFYYTFKFSFLFPFLIVPASTIFIFLALKFKHKEVDKIINFVEKNQLIFLIFILLISLVILYKAKIFDNGIIVYQDYPFHFFRVNLLTNILLPEFRGVIGWSKHFQAGMPEFYDYSPLPYLVCSFLYYIFLGRISLEFIFRITVAFAFLLPVVGIYKFAKSLKFSGFLSLICSLLWLGFPHQQFVFGNYTTYISIGFALFGLSYYLQYLDKNKKNGLLFSSIFFSLTVLSNPILVVPLGFFVLITLNQIKKRDILLMIFLSTLICFIWIVQVFSNFEYISSIHPLGVLYHPEWFQLYYQFFIRFLQLSPALFFFLFFGYLLRKKEDKQMNNLLMFVGIMLVFLLLQEKLINNFYFLSLIQPEKIVIMLRSFLIVLTVYFSSEVIKEKHLSSSKNIKLLLISLISIAFITSSIAYIPYIYIVWSNPTNFLTDNSQLVAGFSINDGFFSYQPKESTIEAFDWIKKNSDNSRILFEDSKEGFLGGYMLAMAPVLTGKDFIGGPFPHMMLTDQNANAFSSIIMGKNITEYSLEEFTYKLDKFNIRYIVAWTPQFLKFLNSYEVFNLTYSSKDNFLHIFEYMKAEKSYATTDNPNTKIELIKFDNKEIAFQIRNITFNDKITIKTTYNNHWHAYVNNNSIKIEKGDLHLISIKSPISGNYILYLEYKPTFTENIALPVSLLSLIGILVLAIHYKKKSI